MTRMTIRAIVYRIGTMSLAIAPVLAASDASGGSSSDVPMVDFAPTQSLPQWLQLGGQIRGRFEDPSGTSLLNNSPDAYYLSRIRLDFGVTPIQGLRFFVQTQDARTGAYNSAPAPATLYNPMDLRQGYIELGHEGETGIRFRAGRQELAYVRRARSHRFPRRREIRFSGRLGRTDRSHTHGPAQTGRAFLRRIRLVAEAPIRHQYRAVSAVQ